MCETVRSTSTIRSRFQLLRMLRKWSSCSLFMYSSPRFRMYGLTSRGPARRLPGSMPSPSSTSAFTAGAAARALAGGDTGAAGGVATPTGRGGFFISTAASPAAASSGCAVGALRGGAAMAFLRPCAAATPRARAPSGLCGSTLRTAGRLAAFLPLVDFWAGLLAGINRSSKLHGAREGCGIIPADPGLYRVPGHRSRDDRRWHRRWVAGARCCGFDPCRRGAQARVVRGAGCQPGCRRSATTVVQIPPRTLKRALRRRKRGRSVCSRRSAISLVTAS